MNLRAMVPDDADEAAGLIGMTFPEPVRQYAAYAQSGTAAHLRDRIEGREHPGPEGLVVAEEQGTIVGCADVRGDGISALLAYLAVAPAHRGHGLGTDLLVHALDAFPSATDVALDVFAENGSARRLYERLGFLVIERRGWYVRPLPKPDHSRPLGQGRSEAHRQDRYGFSLLHLGSGERPRTLGRIGDAVLRCPTETEFCDDSILAIARTAVPGLTEALLVAEQPPTAPGTRRIAEALRMSSPTRLVLAAALTPQSHGGSR